MDILLLNDCVIIHLHIEVDYEFGALSKSRLDCDITIHWLNDAFGNHEAKSTPFLVQLIGVLEFAKLLENLLEVLLLDAYSSILNNDLDLFHNNIRLKLFEFFGIKFECLHNGASTISDSWFILHLHRHSDFAILSELQGVREKVH